MSLSNYISENIFLPVGDFINGQTIYKHLHFLIKSQYWTREQINNYQNDKLRKLIHHANSSVPFYKELFSSIGLQPDDIRKREDLHKIPLLTKSILQDNSIDIFTSTKISKRKRIQNSSSGSTGEPLFYYNTKDAYSMNIAAELRGWYSIGYNLGDNFIKLSQNPRKNPMKILQDKMSNNLYLTINPIIESNFEFILKEIERYKPKFIRCYPDPLLFIARYRQSHPNFKHTPVAIISTGNTLFPETRKEIETIFQCKIFDTYNCEGNSVVFECPTHTCYHSTEEYGISEVINENGDPITKGIGRLISTDLWNLAFPFIRYDTQDLVEIDTEPCICGRKHLKILRILGRDNEVLEMESGRKYIVHNFTGFFQTDHKEINRSIDQFQVIRKESRVIFKLVINKRFSITVSDFITRYWENEMHTKVEVEIVGNIPLTKSGKRRFILNE